MTLTNDDEATTESRDLPRRAQYFTSLDAPMFQVEELIGKLELHPTMVTPTTDIESVWYDFGTDSNPGRVYVIKYGPGFFNPAHAHDTDYCSIVIEGSVEIARKTFGPGSMRFVKAETTYGPTTAGPDGATVVEFFPGPAGGASGPADERGDDSQPYDLFTPAARRVFLPPWVNGAAAP